MSGRKRSVQSPSGDESYAEKRKKNNEAVNKTRAKKRNEDNEISQRVESLRDENQSLERKVESLEKELNFLKEMFMAYAQGGNKGEKSSTDMPSTSSNGTAQISGTNGRTKKESVFILTDHTANMPDGDQVRFATVMQECASTSKDALDAVEKVLEAFRDADKEREGVSLLEVKNREMVAYMAEVSYLMAKMCTGASIAEEPSLLRAAKHRTVLEKIRPIEDKMKAQIDKLSQAGLEGAENCAVTLKARPDQMDLSSDGDDDDEIEDGGDGKKKKYVPPKIMAVRYEEEENDDGNSKAMKRAKQRALQSSLIQELRQQYSDAPEEFRERSQREHRIDVEREKYEEDNLVRLRVTRVDKKRQARAARDNAMDELLQFGSYMMRGEDGESFKPRKRKTGGDSKGDGKRRKMGKVERVKAKSAKSNAKRKRITRTQ